MTMQLRVQTNVLLERWLKDRPDGLDSIRSAIYVETDPVTGKRFIDIYSDDGRGKKDQPNDKPNRTPTRRSRRQR